MSSHMYALTLTAYVDQKCELHSRQVVPGAGSCRDAHSSSYVRMYGTDQFVLEDRRKGQVVGLQDANRLS